MSNEKLKNPLADENENITARSILKAALKELSEPPSKQSTWNAATLIATAIIAMDAAGYDLDAVCAENPCASVFDN